MKNRVLRSTLAVILVITMVLTMAACGDSTTVDPTVAPTATTTPTTAPATTAPSTDVDPTVAPATTTPSTSEDKDTVADDFGISFVGVDGTYGTTLLTDDDDVAIANTYGYFMLTVDEDLTTDNDYEVSVTVDEKEIYTSAATNIAIDGYYTDGDYEYAASEYFTVTTADDGVVYIYLTNAGSYEMEIDVVITDNTTPYGAWIVAEDEKPVYETSLYATATVAKKSVSVSLGSIVIEENSSEFTVDGGESTGVTGLAITFANTKALTGESADLAIDGEKYVLTFDEGYITESAIGTYDITMALYDMSAGETVDIDEFNDLLVNNVVSLTNPSVVVISSYDMILITDVVTSIIEIPYVNGDGNYFDFESTNTLNQITLAQSRYDALTDAQKSFFTADYSCTFSRNLITGQINKWESGTVTTTTGNPSKILDYLEDAQDQYLDYLIVEAFQDVVEAANLDDYAAEFNVKTSAHVTAYTTVDTYFSSLSDDDQEVIEATEGDGDGYDDYQLAEAAFGAAEVSAVQSLISAAFSAYVTAIENGTTIIYQDGSDWAYIDYTEVKTLTAQAQAAYDALTSTQKSAVNTAVATTAKPGSSDLYAVTEGKEFTTALSSLTAMNTMISTMNEVISYVYIEDYFGTDGSSDVYERLNVLVYGNTASGSGSTNYSLFNTGNYAMEDIINAQSRNYDAIIAEYEAWIDFVLYLEDYKADLVQTFKDTVAAELSEIDAEDYGNGEYESVSSMSNTVAKAVIAAINGETSTAVTATTDTLGFIAGTVISASSSDDTYVGEIVSYGTSDDFGSIDVDTEGYESVADYQADLLDSWVDIDSIIDAYMAVVAAN